MQVVIMAAGRGTRMKELTDNVPKPMLEIHGKPILAHKLDALPAEINEVIFIIGYLGNNIRQYFGDEYAGKKISYVVQKDLNGTGGAVHLVKNIIKNDFLVMNADDLYLKNDIKKLSQYDLAVLGFEVNDPWKYGVIFLDKNGNLKNIVEKPDISGPALVLPGVYKLNMKFFDYPMVLSERGEYELIQPLSVMAKDYPVHVEKAAAWFPIGNPDDLKNAHDVIDKFV